MKCIHTIPETVPAEIAGLLRRYHRATGLWTAWRHVGAGAWVAGLIALVACSLDRVVDVGGGWRVVFPWAVAAVCVVQAARVLLALLRRPDYDALALELDRVRGDSRDHLRATLGLGEDRPEAAFFVEATKGGTCDLWRGHDAATFVDKRVARRWLVACLVYIVVVGSLFLVPLVRAPLLVRRFLDPMGNHMRPTATWFAVEPLATSPHRTGDEWRVAARFAGRPVEGPATPLIKILYEDGSSVTRKLTPAEDGVFGATLRDLRRSFRCFLFMGPIRSRQYAVPVLPRPTVAGVLVTYNFPRYARLKTQTEVLKGRTIVALAGTKVKLKLKANVDLASVVGQADEETYRFRVSPKAPREALLHFILNKNQKMHVTLVSAEDVESKHELPFTLRAVADNPPSVSMVNDLDGKSFYLTDTVEIAYRAQDDLGLAAIQVKSLSDSPRALRDPILVELDLPKFGAPVAEGRVRIPVADLYHQNARFLKVSLVAQDTKGQESPSHVATLEMASDSFDRQMRFLLKSYTGHPATPHPERGMNALELHTRRLEAVRGLRNKITILADSMEPNQAPGENQARIVAQCKPELAALVPPFLYGRYWFHDFQNAALLSRFRGYGEYANIWAFVGASLAELDKGFISALAAPNAKGALEALLPSFTTGIAELTEVSAQVRSDYQLCVRELTGYLVATAERQVQEAGPANWTDENFVVNLRAALKEVYGLATNHLTGELGGTNLAVVADVLTAATHETPVRMREALPALTAMRVALQARAAAAVVERLAPSAISARELAEQRGTDAAFGLSIVSAVYQEGDDVETDELFLLQNAMRFLHLASGAGGAFQPVGDPNPAVRAGEAAAFRLYQALQRARVHLERLRLGVVSGVLPLGRPETEAQWLAVREARFALMAAGVGQPPAIGGAVQGLVQSMAYVDNWWPADLADPAVLERLRGHEQDCAQIAAKLVPQIKVLLGKLDRDVAARTPTLVVAIGRFVGAVRDEISFYQTTHDGNNFHDLHVLKARLVALTVSSIKFLDVAELARLHGVGGQGDIDRLVAIFVGLSEMILHFDLKIEGLAWVMQHGIRTDRDPASFWKGKVAAYEGFLARLELLSRVAESSGAQLKTDALQETMAALQIRFPVQTEWKAIDGVLGMDQRLADPGAFLSELAAGETGAAAVWGEIYYLLTRVEAGTASGDAAQASDVKALCAQVTRRIGIIGELPRELSDLPVLLERCSAPPAVTEPREDLVGQLHALLGDMKALAGSSAPPVMPPASERWSWTHHIDQSALARAKVRSKERILADDTMLNRVMAELAMGAPNMAPHTLAWARGEAELDRRKAGLTLNRVGLGGLALAGDPVPVNLPEHIYLELKRARERAMPPLFRNTCYEYLNTVLEAARK